MTNINQLSAASAVSAGDHVPIFSTANGDTRRAAMSVLLAYLQANMTDAEAETLTASEYVKVTAVAVAALPTASSCAGARATVTDSNATLTAGIGAVVAAGGANIVPVFSDGASWRIG